MSYLFVNTKHASMLMEFNAIKILERGDSYRYLTSKITFGSTSELVIGTILLVYLVRKFEREMGSRKVALFCLFVNCATVAIESVVVMNSSSSFNLRYSGPYPLIGAFFSLYHRYTPRLHPRFFSILGINFSEKIFHYVWLAQVASSGGWDSAYSVGIGWSMALCYELVPFFKKLDLPDAIASVFGDLSSRLLESPPRILVPQVARGAGGGRMYAAGRPAAAAAAGGVRPTAAAQRAPMPAAAADPAAIEQLVNMGFSRAQVVDALQSSNNDVQRAAERLLTQLGAQ